MATINSLAPELLDEIFGHLPQLPGQQRYRDICSTSLVCRRWREPAQRVLFQTVVLRSKIKANAWLQSSARTRFRTRGLDIDSEEAWCDEVLEACPGLSSLTLGAARGGGYEVCVDKRLDLKGLASISILYPERFPSNPAALELPNLRHLELYVDGSSHQLALAPLKAILSPSRHSLITLRLRGLGTDTNAAQLIKVLSEEPLQLVRRLTLEEASAFDKLPQILTLLPSLTTLELNARAIGFIGIQGALPTLQSLILTGTWAYKDTSFKLILRMIKLPNLARLRRLELPKTSKDDLACETGLALLDECEERSISLLCRYGYLTRDMMEEVASLQP